MLFCIVLIPSDLPNLIIFFVLSTNNLSDYNLHGLQVMDSVLASTKEYVLSVQE